MGREGGEIGGEEGRGRKGGGGGWGERRERERERERAGQERADPQRTFVRSLPRWLRGTTSALRAAGTWIAPLLPPS